MDVVAGAMAGLRAQLAILSQVCDTLSHRELVALMAEVTTVIRSVPALEHQILARLVAETEPRRLGEASWKKVLTTALRSLSERRNAVWLTRPRWGRARL